jgi:hypothetical protein
LRRESDCLNPSLISFPRNVLDRRICFVSDSCCDFDCCSYYSWVTFFVDEVGSTLEGLGVWEESWMVIESMSRIAGGVEAVTEILNILNGQHSDHRRHAALHSLVHLVLEGFGIEMRAGLVEVGHCEGEGDREQIEQAEEIWRRLGGEAQY